MLECLCRRGHTTERLDRAAVAADPRCYARRWTPEGGAWCFAPLVVKEAQVPCPHNAWRYPALNPSLLDVCPSCQAEYETPNQLRGLPQWEVEHLRGLAERTALALEYAAQVADGIEDRRETMAALGVIYTRHGWGYADKDEILMLVLDSAAILNAGQILGILREHAPQMERIA